MSTKIEMKSAVIGLAIGILAMLAIGAGNSTNEVGRYQVSVTGNPAYGMVIDTATGKVWGGYWQSTANLRNDAEFFLPKRSE